MRTSEHRTGLWRLSLEQIEATVADHLGNGRVPGNQAAACFQQALKLDSGNSLAHHNQGTVFYDQKNPEAA